MSSAQTMHTVESGYAVITPAHNEAAHLAETIRSVLAQTTLPQLWLIVDDGSTDQTACVVEQYAQHQQWICLLRRKRDPAETYFGSNVHAIMDGWRLIHKEPFDFLAILDADITLPSNYYAEILARFDCNPKLGIASGVYENLIGDRLVRHLNDRRSTPKAIQVFRRACFEQICGYLPLAHGGEDVCACVMAQMRGWKTWSYPDLKAIHRRPTGTGGSAGALRASYQEGIREYHLATHPLFMVVKSLRRCCLEPPLVLGGVVRLLGYVRCYLRREPRKLAPAIVRYIRREQLLRLVCFNRIPQDKKVMLKR